MGWNYFNLTNKNVSEADMQSIIDKFPDECMRWNGDRSKKPIKQDWGWATIVDVDIPKSDYQDNELGKVGCVVIGGAYGIVDYDTHSQINAFILEELRKLGYEILKTEFTY